MKAIEEMGIEHVKHQREADAIAKANKKRHDESEKEVQRIKPEIIRHMIVFLELHKNQEFDASEICAGLGIYPSTAEDIAFREILHERLNINHIKRARHNYSDYYSYNNSSSFPWILLVIIAILIILFFASR